MNKFKNLTFGLISLVIFFSCGGEEHYWEVLNAPLTKVTLTEGEILKVVTTTNIIADVVNQIGGSKTVVEYIIPSGQDAHHYEVSPQELKLVQDAHMVFVNGFGFEEGVIGPVMGVRKNNLWEVSKDITPLQGGHQHDEDHHDEDHHDEDHHDEDHHDEDHHDEPAHAYDPHTWMSVQNAISWADVILEALVTLDPSSKDYYEANHRIYVQKLRDLDESIRVKLGAIPSSRRIIIADHGVFGYFAKDYGFEAKSAIIPSFTTTDEASPRHISELASLIQKEGVGTLFVAQSAGEGINRLAQVVAQEAGTEVKVVRYLAESLTAEAPDFISFFRFNVDRIVEGLRNSD